MKNINIQHTARAPHIDDELIHLQNEKLNKIIEKSLETQLNKLQNSNYFSKGSRVS